MTCKQLTMWSIGVLSALTTGMMLAIMTVILGDIVATYDPKNSELAKDMISELFESVTVIAAFVLVVAYLQYSLLNCAANEFQADLKLKLLTRLLEYDMG